MTGAGGGHRYGGGVTRSGKISVIGAGFIGATTAMRLAQFDIADQVVLTDIADGKAEGAALDINQSRAIEGFGTTLLGVTTGEDGSGYSAIAGSQVAVVTAGLPRKPGMSRADLTEVNAAIVGAVCGQIARHAPDAVVIMVSNPLDQMTALAASVTGFDPRRVIGQAGVLDSARFTHFIAERLGVPIESVNALTLGSHGDTMVPVPSQCTVGGVPLTEVLSADEIADIVTRTRNGGAEIVALLKTGSAYFAPSASAARMARAVLEDSGAVMPVCAWVDGQYGISGVYLGVQAELGSSGVRRIVETPLEPSELAALRDAAAALA